MVTRRPRDLSRLPKLEAVSPLPREDATPPVTKTCLVGADEAKENSRCQTEQEKGMSATGFQSTNGFPFADNQPRGSGPSDPLAPKWPVSPLPVRPRA